jgi:HTH-type transcriptional regulator / antitoxin MqsA
MEAVQMLASEKIRDREGLLRSSEIHSIRSRLHLSQQQFEQLLGVGPKTVVRWEGGTVFQNRATDSLLRLIADVPDVVPYLARRNGVELVPASASRA